MKWATIPVLVLAAVVGARGSCDQYVMKITAMENSTCIPYTVSEPDHNSIVDGLNENKCRPTLKVTTNCTCKLGSAATGKQYCVQSIGFTKDDNTVNVTLGLCNAKAWCDIKDIEAYWEVDMRNQDVAERLKPFRRPPCISPSVDVSPELSAAAGCEYFCYQRHNKDIDDGRPCVMEWYPASITGEPVVTLTGACSKGICRYHDSSWKPSEGLCHDSDRYSKYGEIVEGCTYKCPDDTKRNRPYGLTCLIRKTRLTNRNVVGVCNGGSCAEIREDHPCTMKYHNARTVPQRVSQNCLCHGKPVANGTMCALTYSFGFEGYMLQKVGVCMGGTCQERPPERPPKHTFKRKECKTKDVQVTPELIVAAGCRATCRRYETEDRPNGTLCFLRYTRGSFSYFQNKRTYHIGECDGGQCRYSKNSFYIKL
ncbi:uncharacterized protein LOC142575978 [Dermacentor variabilis]|uniref:uncharacterized protein LOC142575978 n=1 Tax=Dermacentor variabilis TaxID=34621 RepID=UPI003F5C1647